MKKCSCTECYQIVRTRGSADTSRLGFKKSPNVDKATAHTFFSLFNYYNICYSRCSIQRFYSCKVALSADNSIIFPTFVKIKVIYEHFVPPSPYVSKSFLYEIIGRYSWRWHSVSGTFVALYFLLYICTCYCNFLRHCDFYSLLDGYEFIQ